MGFIGTTEVVPFYRTKTTICVADYTSDKDKYVARMGHPHLWIVSELVAFCAGFDICVGCFD